jgi:predicted methyltransferase
MQMRSIAALALAATMLTACATADGGAPAAIAAPDAHAAIMAAIADPLRPAADTARDANRKPMEALTFAGVKPGDYVAELAPGGGWYTRLLARAVGPNGHVYALVSPAQAQRPGGLDAINALAAQYGNVTVVPTDYTAMTLPRPVDLVWTTENWHDFHNGPTANPTGIAKAAFAALKPGGIFFIEDHAAAAGAGTSVTQTLHRIEPAAVISEVTSAGFRLEAQGDYLRHPADDHTAGVRDSAVQGQTDKLALRFRKPR